MSDIKLDINVLQKILKNLPALTNQAVRQTAQDVADYMKDSMGVSVAPPGSPPGIDTGTLHDSIQAVPMNLNSYGIYGADYGLYLEYGTVKMAARPFIEPAIIAIGADDLEVNFSEIVKP